MHRREFLQRSAGFSVGASAALAGVLAARTASAEKPAPAKIKIGQIGTAHAHASGKMETLRKFADLYEVVGLVEPDAARRERAASLPAYRDVPLLTEEQLLSTPGLQAVAVETAVRDLVPTGRRCVAAGMHIHLDKPGGVSLEDFRLLLEEATQKKLVVQMGYMLRYNPAFQFLFQALADGWLGDVFEVHGVMSKQVDDATRRELALYPGGTMFELGCHIIDALIKVLGPPDAVRPFTRRTRPGDDLSDNQLAVFEFPQATATIRSSVIEPQGTERRQFTVCGTEGVIDIRPLEPPQLRLALSRPRGSHPAGYHDVELAKSGGRYDGDFLDLAAVLQGEKSFGYSPQHDLAVQEAVLKASGVLE